MLACRRQATLEVWPISRIHATCSGSSGGPVQAAWCSREGIAMSKKQGKKVVVFSLTKPKSEVPFARLTTRLKKFSKMRAQFEELGLRVEVEGFKG